MLSTNLILIATHPTTIRLHVPISCSARSVLIPNHNVAILNYELPLVSYLG